MASKNVIIIDKIMKFSFHVAVIFSCLVAVFFTADLLTLYRPLFGIFYSSPDFVFWTGGALVILIPGALIFGLLTLILRYLIKKRGIIGEENIMHWALVSGVYDFGLAVLVILIFYVYTILFVAAIPI